MRTDLQPSRYCERCTGRVVSTGEEEDSVMSVPSNTNRDMLVGCGSSGAIRRSTSHTGEAVSMASVTVRHRKDRMQCRIYLLGLLLVLLQATVGAEQILIWSQHSHTWTKLRGIYGPTQQWLQQYRKNILTSESARNSQMGSLAYDHLSRHIYWHDETNRKIYRQNANDSLVARLDEMNWELVFERTSGLKTMGGMTVDWLTGNVYWTDSHLKQILMTRKHPTSTDLFRVVVQSGLDVPTNIAVDPVNGWLYWADKGASGYSQPRIERSNMEGGDRITLTKDIQVGHVNSLTLDLTDNSLYFVEEDPSGLQAPKVRKLELNGRYVTEVMTLNGRNYPGIAAHENYIYLVNDDYLEVQVYGKDGSLFYRHTIDAFPHDIVITARLDPRWTPPPIVCDCGDFCIRLVTGKVECRCRDKYYFRLDGKNCVSSEPRFIYAQDGHLWDAIADITLASHSAELTPKLLTANKDFKQIEAIGYHFTKDLAFFSDTYTHDIFRVEVDKKEFVQITANEYRVEGITVCWLSDTLYWTDSILRHIMLSHLDGRYHRILLEDVGVPRGITCDAVNGYLFFVNAEGKSIERMYTNAMDRKTIVSGVPEPQSIVVDPRGKRIYWTQKYESQIHMTDLDGQNRQTAYSANGPYGVTLFQEFMVWTQGNENPRIGVKNNGPLITVSVTNIQQAFVQTTRDIVTFDHFLQPEALGPCLANGGCQQLCFPTPKGPACECAIGYELADDGRSCTTVVAERKFVLFVDPFHKAIYQVDVIADVTRAVPIDMMDFPISIDVDPETGKVIWIDKKKASFRSAYTNGVDEKELWKIPDNRIPKKVAYNENDQKVYFTDQGAGMAGIYSMPRDGGDPQQVIQGLISPSGLALDTRKNMIYFTEVGLTQSDAYVGSISMDGSDRKVLAHAGVAEPSDVAVLSEEDMLFWTDAYNGELWSYNLTAGVPRMLHRDPNKKMTTLSADDNFVYFSARGEKAMFRVSWREPAPTVKLATKAIFARIYDIKAYPNIVLIPPPVGVVTTMVPVMWIGIGAAAVVLLALLLLLAICCARKKPVKKAPGGPAPAQTGGFDDVERANIGITPSSVPDLTRTGVSNGNGHGNGHMVGNGYDDPEYMNVPNTNGHPDGNGPFMSSAPQLSNGNGHGNLANEAMVMSTVLRPTKNKYEKNKQNPVTPVDPNAFEMQGGKVATMVQRLAKRLRTGISSIRWTNERDMERSSRGSQPPYDIDNPGEGDAEQVGAQNPQYKKRPPIGPFKPQLHRLPQGFSPASRVTPSNVKNTWNRGKKKQHGLKSPAGE